MLGRLPLFAIGIDCQFQVRSRVQDEAEFAVYVAGLSVEKFITDTTEPIYIAALGLS